MVGVSLSGCFQSISCFPCQYSVKQDSEGELVVDKPQKTQKTQETQETGKTLAAAKAQILVEFPEEKAPEEKVPAESPEEKVTAETQKERAVTKIQSVFREYKSRKEVKKENNAATKIQSIFRGHKSKKLVKSLKFQEFLLRIGTQEETISDVSVRTVHFDRNRSETGMAEVTKMALDSENFLKVYGGIAGNPDKPGGKLHRILSRIQVNADNEKIDDAVIDAALSDISKLGQEEDYIRDLFYDRRLTRQDLMAMLTSKSATQMLFNELYRDSSFPDQLKEIVDDEIEPMLCKANTKGRLRQQYKGIVEQIETPEALSVYVASLRSQSDRNWTNFCTLRSQMRQDSLDEDLKELGKKRYEISAEKDTALKSRSQKTNKDRFCGFFGIRSKRIQQLDRQIQELSRQIEQLDTNILTLSNSIEREERLKSSNQQKLRNSKRVYDDGLHTYTFMQKVLMKMKQGNAYPCQMHRSSNHPSLVLSTLYSPNLSRQKNGKHFYSAADHYDAVVRDALDNKRDDLHNKNSEPLKQALIGTYGKFFEQLKTQISSNPLDKPIFVILPKIGDPNGIYGPKNEGETNVSDKLKRLCNEAREKALATVLEANKNFLKNHNIQIIRYN